MKMERSGGRDVSGRRPDNTPERAPRRRPQLRLVIAIGALAGVMALVAFLSRQTLLALLVTRGAGIVTGDRVTIGALWVGPTGAVFDDVRVATPAGDPLLQARRVTLQYSLRSLWPDRTHRFGISALTLDGPVFSLVRHGDGSYNVAAAGGGAAAGPASGTAAPWNLDLQVRDGQIRLVDRAAVAADLREQRIEDVRLNAHIRSDQRSVAQGSARYVGRQTQTAMSAAWPITLGATVDFARGAAIARLDASRLPVRGAMSYLQHSPSIRVDDGVLSNVGIRVYALGIVPDRPLDLHVGGTGDLTGGQLAIAALKLPVRDLRGRVRLIDGGVWAGRLDASLAGIPIVARGGGFDRFHPTLRLGLRADGDLHDLRRAFGFAANQPVTGAAHVETLLEAPVSNILIRTQLRVAHGTYGSAPLTAVGGRVDYHAGAVVLHGVAARYGPTAVEVAGRFLLGRTLDSAIVAAASAPGRAIPFAENVAPDADVEAVAVFTGSPDGYRARGALALRGPAIDGTGMFSVDERGRGEFGPFAITRGDGSSIIGALRLERPTSESAAWLSARGFRIAVPTVASRFPGLRVPSFPPVAGVIDGELAGGGAPSAFALAGNLRGRELRVGNARLGTGRTLLGGSLTDVRLGALGLDGSLGRFAGNAAVAAGAFALRGTYDGTLERLIPLTGDQDAHGGVHGEVLATIDGPAVVVQSTGAALHGGRVRGVALESASGTIAVRDSTFHLLVGSAAIAGRRAVAAESGGSIAVSAPDIPSAALRGTGLPLDAGNVSAYGVADLRARSPSFAGTIALAGGRAHGYSLAGDARVDLAGHSARIFSATGALGSTYGAISGSIGGLGEGAIDYDLDARAPLGDIDLLRRDLHLPVRNLAGTFGAELHVSGEGTRPLVDGRVEAPEGVYNGLAFRTAGARVALDTDGVAARDGTLTVGSTTTGFAASRAGGAYAVSAHSAAADLADFNDYFDAGDTLAGQGTADLAFRTDGSKVTTRGALDLQGVRYRGFALGQASAHWRTQRATVSGEARIRSAAGSLDAQATVEPASGRDPRRAFRDGRYAARATVRGIDLGTWLSATGSLGLNAALPPKGAILGRVDAQIGVTGRLPRLALSADATLTDATIAGFAVSRAHLRGSSVGSRIAVAASDADLGFAYLAGDGRLGLAPGDPLAFDLRVTTDDVSRAARAFVPAARGLDLGGALDATVRVAGTRAFPKIQGGFDLRGARYGNFVVPRTIGEVALAGTAIELRAVDVEFSLGQAFVAGSLPLVLTPFGLGPPSAPLSFDVTASGVDLAQFEPLLPAGTKLGGTIDGRFGVEGTVDRPRLLGSLAVVGGSYTSAIERAPIEHVGAQLNFSGSSVALQAFHADVGGGTLDGSGRVTLPLGVRSGVAYRADLTAKGAKLDFPAYGRGTIDGQLQTSGSGTQALVTGDVALRDAVIPVSAVYGAGSAPGVPNALAGAGVDPAFRIRATAADNVRVRSSIVDIGVTGAVDLSGSLHAPRLAGGFAATDGTISSYNHVFRIVNAAVRFNPADGAIPTIDARATSRVTNPDPDPSRNIAGSANIIVTVSGTADSNNLQVSYSSDPAYTQEQIVGLLLDVPALLGAVNFNLNGGAGAPLLRGAPGETNALLPPGVTPEQVSAISFNQEVFSLLNGQFTQRALTPLERAFEKVLGLSDVQFTVDYGGGIGYSLRRQIGKKDFQAFLSQTVTYPERTNVGFELQPKPFESVNVSYYEQNGITSLITNQTPGLEFLGSTRRLTSVQPLGNRSGLSLNFNRRF